MAGTRAWRQRLYRELGELLSEEARDELMETLPPVGWGEIAGRQDLVNHEHALRARWPISASRCTRTSRRYAPR